MVCGLFLDLIIPTNCPKTGLLAVAKQEEEDMNHRGTWPAAKQEEEDKNHRGTWDPARRYCMLLLSKKGNAGRGRSNHAIW